MRELSTLSVCVNGPSGISQLETSNTVFHLKILNDLIIEWRSLPRPAKERTGVGWTVAKNSDLLTIIY